MWQQIFYAYQPWLKYQKGGISSDEAFLACNAMFTLCLQLVNIVRILKEIKTHNLESKEFTGSCATWCMWYVDERLGNPDKSRDKIIQESIEEMQSSSKGFTKFIKKYFQIIKNYGYKN